MKLLLRNAAKKWEPSKWTTKSFKPFVYITLGKPPVDPGLRKVGLTGKGLF